MAYAGLHGTVTGCQQAISRAFNGALDVISRLEYAKAENEKNGGEMITAKGVALIDEAVAAFRERWKIAYEAEQKIEAIRLEISKPDGRKG